MFCSRARALFSRGLPRVPSGPFFPHGPWLGSSRSALLLDAAPGGLRSVHNPCFLAKQSPLASAPGSQRWVAPGGRGFRRVASVPSGPLSPHGSRTRLSSLRVHSDAAPGGLGRPPPLLIAAKQSPLTTFWVPGPKSSFPGGFGRHTRSSSGPFPSRAPSSWLGLPRS